MFSKVSCLPPALVTPVTEGKVCLKIDLLETNPCFEGHFPDFPILPGVVQIHWAALFAQEQWGIRGLFTKLEQIKFTGIVQPTDPLELLLAWNAEHKRIEFEYRVEGERVSSGRIRFSELPKG